MVLVLERRKQRMPSVMSTAMDLLKALATPLNPNAETYEGMEKVFLLDD